MEQKGTADSSGQRHYGNLRAYQQHAEGMCVKLTFISGTQSPPLEIKTSPHRLLSPPYPTPDILEAY